MAGQFEFKDVPQDVPVGSWSLKVRPGMDLGWWGRKAIYGGNRPAGRQWWRVWVEERKDFQSESQL